jgi:hypothetical protein
VWGRRSARSALPGAAKEELPGRGAVSSRCARTSDPAGPYPPPLTESPPASSLGRKLKVRFTKEATRSPKRPITPIGLPEKPKTGMSKPKARSAVHRSRAQCRRSYKIRGHKGQKPVIDPETAVIGGCPIAKKAYLSRKMAPRGR